jgi:hypothetical protein
MEVLKSLFERHFHTPAEQIKPLQGQLGGSGRAILRVSGGPATAIGIVYPVREENVAFLEFSRHFRRHGLPVPQIYAEDLAHAAYLEEDLGDTTLFDFVSKHRSGDVIASEAVEAYRRVVAVLPRFQVEAGRDLNYKVCYPRASFDRQSISWDLNYFKYYFLRLAGIPFNEQALENDFARLTRFLLAAPHDYFLYRDFQSRNIMLREGDPFFVDYQGGRKGALRTFPRSCARISSTLISIVSRPTSPSIAQRSWSTTTRSSTSASCRRWARTGSEDSTSAKRISCRACPTR